MRGYAILNLLKWKVTARQNIFLNNPDLSITNCLYSDGSGLFQDYNAFLYEAGGLIGTG